MRLCRTPLSTRDPAPATRSPSAMSSSCPRHWVPAACKIRQREPSNPIRRPPVARSAWRGSGFRGRTAKLRGPFVCPGEAGCEADAGRCEHLLYRIAPPALGEVAVAYHGRNPFPTGLFPRAFSHGPFPTGGRQRLLSRQGRFATEIRPDRNSRPSLFVFPLSTQH